MRYQGGNTPGADGAGNTTSSDHPDYEAPTIRRIGHVADVTRGERSGDFLDADFPTGTPASELTFS